MVYVTRHNDSMTAADDPDEVTLKLDELKALFDMCVGSMNFASGFLETDDVVLLRKVAVMIGVDPAKATPHEFEGQYPHPFFVSAHAWPAGSCGRCGRVKDAPIHGEERHP